MSQPRTAADLPSSKIMNYIWILSNRQNSQTSISRMELVYTISYCATNSEHYQIIPTSVLRISFFIDSTLPNQIDFSVTTLENPAWMFAEMDQMLCWITSNQQCLPAVCAVTLAAQPNKSVLLQVFSSHQILWKVHIRLFFSSLKWSISLVLILWYPEKAELPLQCFPKMWKMEH